MKSVRVAIATESFLPSLNGVTTSVCRVAENLREQGRTAIGRVEDEMNRIDPRDHGDRLLAGDHDRRCRSR